MGNEKERNTRSFATPVMTCMREQIQTIVMVHSELSEGFEVKVGMHQGSVLLRFLFAMVVEIITKFAREGAIHELVYADDIVLMCKTFKLTLGKPR